MNYLISQSSWRQHLASEFQSEYFRSLLKFLQQEYQQQTVYPPKRVIFEALNQCSFDEVKVVILGQDPYHNPGQAMGLSFSVPSYIPVPPSLQNIFKEIQTDLGIQPDYQNGDLHRWALQGVLLLNSILTVRAGQAGSHQSQGWEKFTDQIIQVLSQERQNLVFMTWGKYAQSKQHLIDPNRHLILEAAHPSPFSAQRGFFGCKHFSQANTYLLQHNQTPIDWS